MSLSDTGEHIATSIATLNEIDWSDTDQPFSEEQPVSPDASLPCKQKAVDAEPALKRLPILEKEISSPDVKPPIIAQTRDLRLPEPCLLPNNFTKKTTEGFERGELTGTLKLRLLREASSFYYGICPKPTPLEYTTMAKTLCNRFPQLKDKRPASGQFGVSPCMSLYSSLILYS